MQITDHTQKLEYQSAVELPVDFPKSYDVIEMSRLEIERSMPLWFVSMHIFKKCLYLAVESERKWIIASVPDRYHKVYEDLGFSKTSLFFDVNSGDGKEKHTIYVFNIITGILGKNLNKFRWSYITEDSIDLSVMKGIINIPVSVRLKNKFFVNIFKLYLRSRSLL